jgi:hypothetical protein
MLFHPEVFPMDYGWADRSQPKAQRNDESVGNTGAVRREHTRIAYLFNHARRPLKLRSRSELLALFIASAGLS